MTTPRKSKTGKGATPRSTASVARKKVKRAAREAKASLDVAAHDAHLALRRTGRTLKSTAREIKQELEQAKAPARKTARSFTKVVAGVFEGAGETFAAVARTAKSRLSAAGRTLTGQRAKATPAHKTAASRAGKPAASKPAAAKRTSQRKLAA